jgi:hypothetical protein
MPKILWLLLVPLAVGLGRLVNWMFRDQEKHDMAWVEAKRQEFNDLFSGEVFRPRSSLTRFKDQSRGQEAPEAIQAGPDPSGPAGGEEVEDLYDVRT